MIQLQTRFSLTAPKGAITPKGIDEITTWVNLQRPQTWALDPPATRVYLPPLPHNWEWQWLVERGKYRGNFPKRVASYYWKGYALKFPNKVIESLGNLARKYTEDNHVYQFDFVNRFDWTAGEFGDRSSCFMYPHSTPLAILEENGALAIRFYDAAGKGFARAWIAPVRGEQYVVFNGYGFPSHSTMIIARVLAQFLNLPFSHIDLSNHSLESGTLYINGGAGYWVGQDALSRTFYDLGWGDDETDYCEVCGEPIAQDEIYRGLGDEYLCESCFNEHYDYCGHCGETMRHEDAYYTGSDYRCERCFYRDFDTCSHCGEPFPLADLHAHEGDILCASCLESS